MINIFVLPSTLLLTLLMMVGLFFFVKASVKERIQQVKLVAQQSEESILSQLEQYFAQRAYRVTALDQDQVTFAGLVRPSLFLATFLTLIVAAGLLCLGLVLSILMPQIGTGFLGLVLLAPLAGLFYWQRAGREEKVRLKVEPLLSNHHTSGDHSLLTVTAHRDELAALQHTLKLRKQE